MREKRSFFGRTAWLPAVAVGFALLALQLGDEARAHPGTIHLFNGRDLTGWYSFLTGQGKNVDRDGVFKIRDGEIHVTGQHFGYLSTIMDYDRYDLSVDFKWGEKKWPPRENAKRDAGVLYAVRGADMVWANCLELQVQEGDTGDLWLIPGQTEAPAVEVLGHRYGGEKKYQNVVKWSDQERPNGQWNTVRVRALGDRFEHWVNGVLVMRGRALNGTRGRINLQSEGAELVYRKIDLTPLP